MFNMSTPAPFQGNPFSTNMAIDAQQGAGYKYRLVGLVENVCMMSL